MRQLIIAATVQALKAITDVRLHRTERGFHGRFYCELQSRLRSRGLLDGNVVLEMEYQKAGRHGIAQRPDIILHIPREHLRARVVDNNFAVWALKRRASATKAAADMDNLNDMFGRLRYPLGFFVNVDDSRHHSAVYSGQFRQRLVCVAAELTSSGRVRVYRSEPRP